MNDKDKKETEKAEPTESDDKKSESPAKSESGLKPSKLKIGEDSENLKQRAEWFRKRTGKS